jgi:long-chain fatty acid transport protein
MNNKLSSLFVLTGACLSTPALATNGYQLIGIGGYQKSLAGAVTANPGSAMTAITNPAGMARIGKRADFSMELFLPDRFVDFTALGGERNDSAAEQYGVPALGWTAPVEEGNDDVYFGGGIYGTSGLGADYPLTRMVPAGAFGPGTGEVYFEGYSTIQFWQMAPTLAWNHNKDLTFGVSLNIDYQSVALKQTFVMDTTADGTVNPDSNMVNVDLSRTAQAFGLGITLGVLYDVNEQVTVGASYKSEQNFSDLEYQLGYGDIQGSTNPVFGMSTGCPVVGPSGAEMCAPGTYVLALDFPQMISLGIAYSPIEALTLSLDVKRIAWSDTLKSLDITGPNNMSLSLASGWEDQTIIAIGVEYVVSDRLMLRAGYNRADAPFDEADAGSNLILPGITEEHMAVGADWHLNRSWDVGFHLSRASQNTMTATAGPATGAKIGLEITTIGLNLGYRF